MKDKKMSSKECIEFFEQAVEYWSKRLRVHIDEIRRDRRFVGHMITWFEWEPIKVQLCYNDLRLKYWSKALILCGIFHEFNHIREGYSGKMKPNTGDLETNILEEYRAEKYALRCMKKWYPNMVKEVCEFTKKKMTLKKWRKDYPIHLKAWSRIPDYKEDKK